MKHTLFAMILVAMMLLAGCVGSVDNDDEYDEDGTPPPPVFDGETPAEIVAVPHTEGCDSLSSVHCMLPFPSDAFLRADESTETGWRVNYSANTLPASGSVDIVEIPALNRLDGMSPSTEIMTAFAQAPVLTDVANQHSIATSLEDGHPTILLNLNTGERVAHWVELDARADSPEDTIVFIRTLGPLDANTAYGVGMSGMGLTPSTAFAAFLAGNITDAPDIEARRDSLGDLVTALGAEGHDESNLKAAWMFRTASLDSMLGGILSMRADALDRLGEDGINCTITSVQSDWLSDTENDFRLIKGTYTVPQYLEWQNPPSRISRDDNGTPQFVENAEIPFTMMIPQSLADANESGPLTIFGHGFLGQGEYYGENLVHGWAQAYNVPFIATDLLGWSHTDVDTIAFGLFDPSYFEHQADRLQQMLVNHLALARTFGGVCANLEEYENDEGTMLVDSRDILYMGYSLGGIYGASITAFSPDIDRAALWVGGSGFSSFIERSTNYERFDEGFAHSTAYPARNDRAVLIAVCQQMWDASDPETWLQFAELGDGDTVTPFRFLSTISINDAQVPGISADRSARASGAFVLSNSSHLPYGVPITEGNFSEGSVIVYWDGGYDAMPETNAAPPMADSGKAHNEIGPIAQVNAMVEHFLHTGTIIDTCDGPCVFDYDTDQAEW